MRLVFAGTPEFARCALEKLHAAGHQIALVLTQPDRPAGRGMKLQASPVKQFAETHDLPIAQPRSLRLDGKYPDDAAAARAALLAADAQAMVVAAYGLILPQWVLDAMAGPGLVVGDNRGAGRRHGCLNIHGSLLPRWRGAAPIHRAIEAGDAETGVTIMQMDAGLDTGDMLLMEALPIHYGGPSDNGTVPDTTGSLHDKLAQLGARMVVRALELAQRGELVPVPQPANGITYAHKIEKQEARIDWALPADLVVRRVRAFNPAPGAFTQLNGEVVKIWAAAVSEEAGAVHASGAVDSLAGSIVELSPQRIRVAAGSGCVDLTQLQRPGGKRLGVADFLRGCDWRVGMRFDGASAGAP